MPTRTGAKHNTGSDAKAARRRIRPAKGTGAALLELAGAWDYMSPEEIERIKKDIFESRRSSP